MPEAVAKPKGRSRRQRAAIVVAAQMHRLALYHDIRKTMVRLFRQWRDEYLDVLDKHHEEFSLRQHQGLAHDLADEILDPEDAAERMATALHSMNQSGLVLGGQFQRELLGADGGTLPWTARNDAINKYMADYGSSRYLSVATETHRQMTKTVADAVREQKTWKETRSLVTQKFGQMADYRSANIATTESTRLYGAGGQAFRETYNITHKQWAASFVNTRDTHADADGQIVRNDEPFRVGADSMQFPGDGTLAEENCNCNCVSIPVFVQST